MKGVALRAVYLGSDHKRDVQNMIYSRYNKLKICKIMHYIQLKIQIILYIWPP